MTISISALSGLIACALVFTLLAPIILLALFIKDFKKGELW